MSDQALMQKIKQNFGGTIAASAGYLDNGKDVPPSLLAALIANESGGDPNATRFEPAVCLQLTEVLMGKLTAYSPHGIKRPLGSGDLLARLEPAGAPRPPLRSALFTLMELATSRGLTQIMGWHALEFGRAALTGSPTDQLNFTVELLGWFAERYQLDYTKDFEQLFHCWNTGTPTDPPATYDPNYVANGMARMQAYENVGHTST